MGNEFNYLSIGVKMLLWIKKKILWRNNNILYINDNKKVTDKNDLRSISGLDNYKIIRINKRNRYKSQLREMKFNLYMISCNKDYNFNLAYTGFASVPFSVFDGYNINDNHKITLLDYSKTTKKYYQIPYLPKLDYNYNEVCDVNCENVNLVISSSYDINIDLINNKNPIHILSISKINDKLDLKYLNEMYSKTYSFLNNARSNGVKKVNIYLSSRSCVAFAIGMAIQTNHPDCIVYEFNGTEYTWALDIKKGKIYCD